MSDGFFSASKARSKQPLSKVAKCGACRLKRGCKYPQMPITGKGGKKILIVLQTPESEDTYKTQSKGTYTTFVRNMLRSLGVSMKDDCWKINAVICRTPKDRAPHDKEVDACRPFLFQAIEKYQPNVIIPMGGAAVKSLIEPLFGDSVDSLRRWVGQQIPSHKHNCWICPTYHPKYLIELDGDTGSKIARGHIRKAVALKEPPFPYGDIPKYEDEVVLEHSPRLASKWLRVMSKKAQYMTFDYETNMLKPESKEARIVCCSVCFRRGRTLSFPWHGEAIDTTLGLLQSPLKKIAANLKFEDRWTRTIHDIQVENWFWDTMLAAHIINNGPKVSGLKFQSYVNFGLPVYNQHLDNLLRGPGSNLPNQIDQIDLDDLLLYGGIDSLMEHLLAMKQMKHFGIRK